MSDLSLAIQKEVAGKLAQKAIVIDRKGNVFVDGLHLEGLNGARALGLFQEGVIQDIKEYGPAETERMYREKARTQGGLGHALQASVNLQAMLDADEVAGR
jgi:hypothetical protein